MHLRMLSAPRVTDLDVTLPGIPPPPKLIPGSGLAMWSAALTESEKLIVVSALRTHVLDQICSPCLAHVPPFRMVALKSHSMLLREPSLQSQCQCRGQPRW